MSELKKIIRKIPVVYPLWHKFRIYHNMCKEKKKVKSYQLYGREILKEISDMAIANNLELMCAWGTLLGIVRDGELLPWDDDLDFILLKEKDFAWNELDELMKKNGFWLYREFEEANIIKEKSYKKKGVLCDIRVWDVHTKNFKVEDTYYELENIEYENGKYCEYEVSYIDMVPVEKSLKKEFYDFHVLIPANSEEVLEASYGSGWRVPDSNYKSPNKRYSIMRKATYYRKK